MFKSLLSKLRRNQKEPPLFNIDPIENGLLFIVREAVRNNLDEYVYEHELFALQLAKLRMLHEQGLAEKNDQGYFVPSKVVISLDESFNQLFDLPEYFDGSFRLDIKGITSQPTFDVNLKIFKDYELAGARLNGPFLQMGSSHRFSLTEGQWTVLKSVEEYKKNRPSKDSTFVNNLLIHRLKEAVRLDRESDNNLPKLLINLEQFENLRTQAPETVRVSAERDSAGNLILGPVFANCSPDDIGRRLANIPKTDGQGVLHVGNEIVLMTPKVLHAVHQILNNRIIPKERVKDFLKSPTAFIKDTAIDFDSGFSLRVTGAERFTHKYFGEVEAKSSNWFEGILTAIKPIKAVSQKIDDLDDLLEFKRRIRDAYRVGAETVEFKGETYDVSDASQTGNALDKIKENLEKPDEDGDFSEQPETQERVVVKIEANDEQVDYRADIPFTEASDCNTDFSVSNLLKTPFAHQNDGIRWILSRYELGQLSKNKTGGGLLADDMGLGKTFMTLVALEEIQKRYKAKGLDRKPVLIVAPLSLIENWENEVKTTFKDCPFEDIVVLQANRDLKEFKIEGSTKETLQHLDASDSLQGIHYALKVGKEFIPCQLDRPGRMVLTTYDTLREYQFSLNRIDWSFVAFDEAQALKNPNTLATIAAKGLKADFKLLMTGTPVENSLKDIWCLMDTALPGLLGAWQDFRTTYIHPINSIAKQVKLGNQSADVLLQKKIEIGKALRSILGDCMLRRTKEDQLSGLPKKVVYSPCISQDENICLMSSLGMEMQGFQLESYNNIVKGVTNSEKSERAKMTLQSLQNMKIASIHHGLINPDYKIDEVKASDSCKLLILNSVLEDIRKRDEKVILFAISKRVQEYLSVYLQTRYKVPVRVVNGETKAVANTGRGKETRKSILDDFQSRPGFGIIILSPVAVGVGLTIVGANNVIHVERHWNPAKEAQATDRVYRIGQKRQVNVYLPMALHPDTESFDEKLNQLLEQKIDLSSAVVATEDISAGQMESLFN